MKLLRQVSKKGRYFLFLNIFKKKHEKPVAEVIPYQQEPKMTRQEAFEKMKELRKNYRGKPGSFNIREAIEEGRK